MRFLLRSRFELNDKRLERNVFGLAFKNPVGLAAGFDKDAKMINELGHFGFGFIEIGTLTPKPQVGNPKPRLFRLEKDKALINRMGFNNSGVLDAVGRLKNKPETIIIGGNIGKNSSTENRYAFRDYEYCFEALYEHVDYLVINVSSPNTPELRELQDKEPLKVLLSRIKQRSEEKNDQKPILLKIAPDLTEDQLEDIVEILQQTHLDGVIATNTTISRENLTTSQQAVDELGMGGLSGCPLAEKSNKVIRFLRDRLGPDYPIIGVGGIMSTNDALKKLDAGASLIQIYTGFIYNGPSFVKQINKAILKAVP